MTKFFSIFLFFFFIFWLSVIEFFIFNLYLIIFNFVNLSYFFVFSYKKYFLIIVGIFFLPIWILLKFELFNLFNYIIPKIGFYENILINGTSAFCSLLFLSFFIFLWIDLYINNYKVFCKKIDNYSLSTILGHHFLSLSQDERVNLSYFTLLKILFILIIENFFLSIFFLSLKFKNITKNFFYIFVDIFFLSWYIH